MAKKNNWRLNQADKGRSHDRRHYLKSSKKKDGNKARRLMIAQMIRDTKGIPCADCGVSYPHYVMDFDHKPGHKKEFNLAAAAYVGMAVDKIKTEMAKCDVVCSNCHRIRTWSGERK